MRMILVAMGLFVMGALQGFPGELQVASIFSDNMVLQREKPVRIWGRAHPGEKIVVTFKSQTESVRADWVGKWSLELASLTADSNPESLTVKAGTESVTFTNVLVGEVWLASGQSNMFFPVKSALNPDQEIANADFPDLRLFSVNRISSIAPLEDITVGEFISWQSCTPESISEFSAVAYYFARDLHQKLGVPVGIIHSSWGGTPIESWMPMAVLQAEPLVQTYLNDIYDQGLYFEARKAEYDETRAKFDQAKRAATRAGKEFKQRPPREMAFPGNRKWPSGLWNAMIHPLAGVTLRGAIWYQGEANAGKAYAYRSLFPAMIQAWRDAWGQDDFPFYWVQLANYQLPLKEPAATFWAELRQAQTETLSLTHTAQALAIDLADPDNPKDIHPHNKQEVGRRLALLARKNIYGETDLVAEGPVVLSHHVKDGKVVVHFNTNDAAGMIVKGDHLTGFAIAGADQEWVWADAELNPDGTVTVWSDQIAAPVAVRYAFETNPSANLYNRAGLPATPFRTDDWGWITAE